jgi:hypothetical protein
VLWNKAIWRSDSQSYGIYATEQYETLYREVVPCLIKPHALTVYRRMKVQLDAFLILALDESEWLASCYSHFTPFKEPPSTPIG